MMHTNVSNTEVVNVVDEQNDFVNLRYSISQQHGKTGLKAGKTLYEVDCDATEFSVEANESIVSAFDMDDYELSLTSIGFYPIEEVKYVRTTTRRVRFSTITVREYNINENEHNNIKSTESTRQAFRHSKEQCFDVNELELLRKVQTNKSVHANRTQRSKRCNSPPPTISEHTKKFDKAPTIPKRIE